ncbi:hypothetical protein [Streptomyces sp. ISL-12]|uniref:hypothetical protein n=1 Tax=Streptomyces sp. ISL-12 TaxID=2819177 RepID=UPI0020362B51|nr:hypothetical protein [Streptomyces sp. ISL-12]
MGQHALAPAVIDVVAPEAVPGIVGLSPALTHSLERHARGALRQLRPDTDPQE